MSGARPGRVPPVAPREPFVRHAHGVATPDPYRWMRNRADARLIAYLQLKGPSQYEAEEAAREEFDRTGRWPDDS